MVSLFGQVWLWSLLSFVAGVLVTWLVQVRPAKQRLAELEANRLSAPAGPARPQPQAPPSRGSSPMRDEEFDDWHVGARASSDPAQPPEQMWPYNPAQEVPLPYEPPVAYEQPRPVEPPRPLEPQRLIEPPLPVETPHHGPEQTNNDVGTFVPAGAFGRPLESEAEPDQGHDYDELPPALTRIPENAEPGRVVEPVEVPEEEKPRSLFQRLGPEAPEVPLAGASMDSEVPLAGASTNSVQAEPVPLNPAEESTVFRRADLDELPEVPEIPADRTRYLPPVAPEIARPREEQIAPPEVEDWHPREVWREEEEEQVEVDQPAAAVQEAELLDDREEDFAADDTVREDAVPAETPAEETSVISTDEVRKALDADRQPWPEHSLTGQFPIVSSDDIASSKGQLGVEPDDPDDRRDDPDDRRDDPDELTAKTADVEAADVEAVATDAPEARDDESRGADFRAAQAGIVPARGAEPDAVSRGAESDARGADFRAAQAAAAARGVESDGRDYRPIAPRAEVRETEPEVVPAAPPVVEVEEAPAAESVEAKSAHPATEFLRVESRPEPEQPSAEAPAAKVESTEFFPVKQVPVEFPAAEKRPAAANFFAPQPIEAEPVAPVAPPAKAAKPTPAQPAERPRSLFEPILGESDDDPQPQETVRQLPPSDDQPFVPTLAPELLARGTNGLPQRPQRPAGGPPPMTSAPLLGPPQPVARAPLPQKPVRPRPVGFSPSTGGRSEPPAPVAPRFQQSEGFNPRSPFGPGSVLPKSDGYAPAPDFEVKATLTGRRYFRPGTSDFDGTRADVWFRTEADAQKAGFRPAQ